jgi:hypothetical protein
VLHKSFLVKKMPETEGWNKKEGEQNMNRSKEEERMRMRESL